MSPGPMACFFLTSYHSQEIEFKFSSMMRSQPAMFTGDVRIEAVGRVKEPPKMRFPTSMFSSVWMNKVPTLRALQRSF